MSEGKSEEAEVTVTDPGSVDEVNEEDREPVDKDRNVSAGGEPPILKIIDRVADRAEPLMEMFKTVGERYQDARKAKVWFRIGMTAIAVVMVLAIVGIAAYLTLHDKIEGSTFGFLLGLIIGYMLTFIRDAIGPTSTDEF
jgi:hypothetical protein